MIVLSNIVPAPSLTLLSAVMRAATCVAYHWLICTSFICEAVLLSGSCDSSWCELLMLMKLKKMSLRDGASIIVATRERSQDSDDTTRSRMSWLRMGTSTSLAEFKISMPLELYMTSALAVSAGRVGFTQAPAPVVVLMTDSRLSMSWSAVRCAS